MSQSSQRRPSDSPPTDQRTTKRCLLPSVFPTRRSSSPASSTGATASQSPAAAQRSQAQLSENSASRTQDALGLAWNGFKTLMRIAESAAEGTPTKAPIVALNTLIEIGEATSTNKTAIRESLAQADNRAASLAVACKKSGSKETNDLIAGLTRALQAESDCMERLKGQRTWRQFLSTRRNTDEIQTIVKRINDHLATFERDILLRVDRNTDGLRVALDQLRLDSWPHAPEAEYDDYDAMSRLNRRGCTPGTRKDILKTILTWAEDTSADSASIYWLNGLAGIGKSTIAYSICDRLSNEPDGSSRCILGATFFCSRQFPKTRQQNFIIPTLAYQLARHSVSFADALLKVDRQYKNKLNQQILRLLVEPWLTAERPPNLPPILLVIDALDENEGGSAFLRNLLESLTEQRLPGGPPKTPYRGLIPKFRLLDDRYPDTEKATLTIYSNFVSSIATIWVQLAHLYLHLTATSPPNEGSDLKSEASSGICTGIIPL